MDVYEEYNTFPKCKSCPYFEQGLSDMGYCDKVGGKISWYGSCTDYPMTENFKEHNRKKRRNKRERDAKYRAHLKYLVSCDLYYVASYETECYLGREIYCSLEKPYYKRRYLSQHGRRHGRSITSYAKRKCNRAVRRYEGEIPKGGSYKKISDFWWEVI